MIPDPFSEELVDVDREDLMVRAKCAVEKFFEIFQAGTVIGLILPDGWLGRPYDNYYELRGVTISRDVLEVDLGWGWNVALIPNAVTLSADRCALTVRGTRISASTIDSSRRYDEGDVQFVVSETSEIVRKIVEERDECLRTMSLRTEPEISCRDSRDV